ncbi:MAG: Hsp70 family protein [Verrucomicrobiales bacterium]
MADFVGIDLGTSTSALAYLRSDGNPEIVPNADGERLTPSVVYFDKHEDIKLVGSAARDGGDPDRTIHFIKNQMDNPDYTVEMDGEKWTPTEISAMILAKLKRDCANIIGEVNDVVITVPANFNEMARRSTIAAGRIAGLNVKRIVNEPTAAALYYAHTQSIQGRTMVYDLGGGTLDITILEVEGKNYRILTSEGARRLGGTNFDEIILDLYAAQYRKMNGAELFQDERQRRRILNASEDAKKMLSKLRQITDTVGNDTDGIARVELTREMFEEAIGRLLTRTVMLVEQALASVSLVPGDIDNVVLVGGSTRMPRVRDLLKKIFGSAPRSCGNVDECVALGAALFAKHSASVQEICNHGYGTLALVENIETGEESFKNTVVIPKNTPIPCAETQTYVTSEDDERIIEVEITQGEDDDPRYVDIVGRITLEVPPNRPAGCEVSVTYSYDENQRVRALVVDERTKKSKEVAVTYDGAGVLSDAQIEERRAQFERIHIE